MPRTRHLLSCALAAVLSLLFAMGALAEPAIKKVDPAVKAAKGSYTIRPGIDTEIVLTLTMPGYLSVRTLDADGNEIETLCTDVEYPSGSSSYRWDCTYQTDGSFYPAGDYRLGFTLRDEYGAVSKEYQVKVKTGTPRPVVSNVEFSNENAKNPWTFTADLSMAGKVSLHIYNATNLTNRLYEIPCNEKAKAGSTTIAWNGKIVEKEDNEIVDTYTLAPGNYAVRIVLTDADNEDSADEPLFITVVDDKKQTPYITGTEPEIVPEEPEETEPEAANDDSEEDADSEGEDAGDKETEDQKDSKKDTARKEDDRVIGKAIKNDINVRSKPTKKGVRITRLKLNETVTVKDTVTGDDGETWYFIHTRSGDEGYALTSLIEIQ